MRTSTFDHGDPRLSIVIWMTTDQAPAVPSSCATALTARCAARILAGVTRLLDLIAAIEAAYDRSSSDVIWLEQLARIVAPSFGAGSSHPISTFIYDLHPNTGIHISDFASVGDAPYTCAHFEKQHAEVDAAAHRLAYECDMFTLLSRAVGEKLARTTIMAAGMTGEDSLGLRANITPTSGVILTTHVPRGYRIRDRTMWTRLASHVGTAARLRRTPSPGAPSVLTPSGKLEHGTARAVAARADLASAAKSMDRARGKLRRVDPEAASALWQAMVRGEWSLVDWIDHDGKRFLLAYDNPVEAAPRQGLTARERQVVACAAMGHTNKLIAYDLGLSTGSVSAILSRAAKKLGVSSRVALIRAYRDLAASTPGGHA